MSLVMGLEMTHRCPKEFQIGLKVGRTRGFQQRLNYGACNIGIGSLLFGHRSRSSSWIFAPVFASLYFTITGV